MAFRAAAFEMIRLDIDAATVTFINKSANGRIPRQCKPTTLNIFHRSVQNRIVMAQTVCGQKQAAPAAGGKAGQGIIQDSLFLSGEHWTLLFNLLRCLIGLVLLFGFDSYFSSRQHNVDSNDLQVSVKSGRSLRQDLVR
jgi:hypothetical protein